MIMYTHYDMLCVVSMLHCLHLHAGIHRLRYSHESRDAFVIGGEGFVGRGDSVEVCVVELIWKAAGLDEVLFFRMESSVND